MNQDTIKGNWNQVKGKIKQHWADFTDDEILRMEGNHDELLGALQKKYGYDKERAHEELDRFINDNHWN